MSLKKHKYSIAITFRTFIELSLIYLAEKQSEYTYNQKGTFKDELRRASNFLFGGSNKTREEQTINSSIVTAINKENNINILHGIVHNLEVSTNRVVLIDFYDTLQPLFHKIYN